MIPLTFTIADLAMSLPDACPDPSGHYRLYVERETTWREDRAGLVRPQGLCGWCGCEQPENGVRL